MAAINWDALASPADWENALLALEQAAARAGTRADRAAVESQLENFWLIPCPFTTKTERARALYNELALLDLGQLTSRAVPPPAAAATTGADLLRLAETRLGEKCAPGLVPKDNPNWHGPWDCAEFVAWVVYQTVHRLCGCANDHGNPATTEACPGAWVVDAQHGPLLLTTQAAANATAGVVLIRQPPLPGQLGHVALSDGRGGTVEAAGSGLNVRRGPIESRLWHYCAQVPGVTYAATGAPVPPQSLPHLLTLQDPNIQSDLVGQVQRALQARGFDPGVLDSLYGPHTLAAVAAFQRLNRLVVDGLVGPATARKLGVEWPAG